MSKIEPEITPIIIEENAACGEKNVPNSLENSDNLANLLAEIIVENFIKKYRNGRNRVCKDK